MKCYRFKDTLYFLYISVDFVLDQKGVSLLEAYDKWRGWADGKVCCDYGLHVGVTWWGAQVAKDMEVLCAEKGLCAYEYGLSVTCRDAGCENDLKNDIWKNNITVTLKLSERV